MNRAEIILRIIFLIVFGAIGAYYGAQLAPMITQSVILVAAISGVVCGLLGFVIAPYLTIIPARGLRVLLTKLSTQTLIAALVGLVAGLLVAALLAFPLSFLPSPFGDVLPFIGVLVFSYVGVIVFVTRQNDILGGFRNRFSGRNTEPVEKSKSDDDESQPGRTILLDTSVIINGRIADIRPPRWFLNCTPVK